MMLKLGAKIAEAFPTSCRIQVDLRYCHGSPVFGKCHGFAGVVPNRGKHPVTGNVLVGAADQVHVILHCACLREFPRVAVPVYFKNTSNASFVGPVRRNVTSPDNVIGGGSFV